MQPETRYARLGAEHIAYQVLGDGAIDVVFVPEWANHLELQWEQPACARFLERLGSYSRLIMFDKRGTGLSDPVRMSGVSGVEDWIDDMTAVLDTVGSQPAVLVGSGAGGPMTMLYAATFPDRVRRVVLLNTAARFVAADDYPIGLPAGRVKQAVRWTEDNWGTGATIAGAAPSVGDEAARTFHGRMQRQSASPSVAAAFQEIILGIDLREVLASLHLPTLVLHRSEDRLVSVEHGRYLGAHIPDAKYVELAGADHVYYYGDAEPLLREIQEFVTGCPAPVEPDRVLATMLFTDIVRSTDRNVELGDAHWRALLDRHDAAVRHELERFHGREINTVGDAFFAAFDSPSRAVRCAWAIRDAANSLGLHERAGMHTGEVEVRGDDYAGVAVTIASRVAALAEADEVLITRTVKDIIGGSDIRFVDRGTAVLRGVPDEWQLYAVKIDS